MADDNKQIPWQADPCTHTDNPNKCKEEREVESLQEHLAKLAF